MSILAQNAISVDKSIKFEMAHDYKELKIETLLRNDTRKLECLRFIIEDDVFMREESLSFGKGSEIHLFEKEGNTYILLENPSGDTFFMNMDAYSDNSDFFIVSLGKSGSESERYLLKKQPKDERIVNLLAQFVRFENAKLFTTKKMVNK